MIFQDKKHLRFTLITTSYPIREPESKHNRPDLKHETLLNIKKNKIYLNENLFDTDEMKKNNVDFYITWILDKKGNIYAGAQCHAYYIKSKPGKPFYGYAKPLACGGDFIVSKGKITYIDNRSGHYKPTTNQFKDVLKYFYSLGILSENCEIKLEQTGETIPINNGYF